MKLLQTCRSMHTAACTSASATASVSDVVSFASRIGNTVTAHWLREHQASVQIIDGSWYMPAAKRSCFDEHMAARVPSARFFDIDAIADKSTDLPHMLPSDATFTAAVASMGITKRKPIIVYDTSGLFAAARVWWTFKAFGAEQVAVLDGGLPAWLAAEYPIESGTPTPATPVPHEDWHLDRDLVVDYDFVRKVSLARGGDRECALELSSSHGELPLHVDARPAGRFLGTMPEPRPSLSSGHTPHSVNVPYTSVLTEGVPAKLLDDSRLKDVFEKAGVPADYAGPIVMSCGSGITACIVSLALNAHGREFKKTKLYDGSWTDYAARPAAAIEKALG